MRYYSSTAVVMALTGSVDNLAMTLVVDTVLGLPISGQFTLVLDVGLPTEEIVTVTGVSGANLTVARGEDGSTAVAHTAGAIVRHMMTARDLREPAVHVAAATNVHSIGATASVVGTDTAQTLTNKTINAANNTVVGIPQESVTGLVDHIAAIAAHGTAGSVVGTTDAQTLTNKTLSSPVVTEPPSNIHNPIGTLLVWAGSATAPTGYLIADGAAVSRTTYSALFAVIGTVYGVGDGFTTFDLPALSGRVIVGFDATQTQFDAMGETGGTKTHILSAAEMPAHTHIQNAHAHGIHMYTGGATNDLSRVSGNGTSGFGAVIEAQGASTVSTVATNQDTGGGGAHNNLQPYITLRYIIKI